MPNAPMSMAERAQRQLNSGCVPEVVVRNLVGIGLGQEEARRLVADIRSGKVRVTANAAPRESLADALLGLLNGDTIMGLILMAVGLLILATLVHRHVVFLSGFRLGVLVLLVGIWRTCAGILKQD